MRFTINLATRTYLDHRLINRLAFCAVALLVTAAAWNVSRVSSYMGEQSRLNAEIASLQSRLGAGPSGVSVAESNRLKTRIRFYNEIIQHKCTNWLSLLELFENVTPDGIALSSLSQDKGQGAWKLDGRAGSFKTVRLYLEKLESSKSFTDVMLLSHQNVLDGEKIVGVQFTITCRVVNW